MRKSSQLTDGKKRKVSGTADDLPKTTAPQQLQVRFQAEERPAKRRFVVPGDYAPVRQPCVVDAAEVTAGRQELWLIQLPNAKAMRTLAALGSVEVDLHNARGTLSSFQDPDGNNYRLQQESGDVSHQLVAVCSTADEAGAAQPAAISRRLTLVRASEHAVFGGLAGEVEDEEAALARFEASLAAMEEARRESEAIAAIEGGWVMPAPDSTENGAAGAAATTTQTTPQAPKSKEKHKEKSKDKGKDKEKDKSRKKDKEGHKVTPAPCPLGAPAAAHVTPGQTPAAAAAERTAGKESGKAGKSTTLEAAKTQAAGTSTVGTAATPKLIQTAAVAATPKQSEPVAAATPLQDGGMLMDKEQKDKKSSKKDKQSSKKDKHKDKKEKKVKKEKKEKKERKESKSAKKEKKDSSASSGSESE